MQVVTGIMRFVFVVFLCATFLAGCEGVRSYSGFKGVSDQNVCAFALTPWSQPLDWDPSGSEMGHIQEAKRRGLSLQKCAELTGRRERSTLASFEDEGLCHLSLRGGMGHSYRLGFRK